MILVFYFIIPILGLVLFFLSRKEKLPEDMKETGISRQLLKMSMFIYTRTRAGKRLPGSEKIRLYLNTLNYSRDMEKVEMEYYIRKISLVLLMAFAGSFLAIVMFFSSFGATKIEEGALIRRNRFGGGNQKIELVASDREGKKIGNFSLDISEQLYEKAEADKLFEEAAGILEQTILGENETLDEVSKDLNLVTSLSGYPFKIAWSVDNYDVMSTEGKLKEEAIPEKGIVVGITATFSYNREKWQQLYYANVLPQKLTAFEKRILDIRKLLEKSEEETRYEDMMSLPESYKDEVIIWSEKTEDNSLMILILMLVGGCASFVLKDKELKDSMNERNNQLLMDYPQLVSQLALYLGAGMTMRNIFEKLSITYERERQSGEKMRYVYEEVSRTFRELSAGASEAACYEAFGIRCGGQQYTRLGTLLSQNLRKGSSEFLTSLEEESQKAFEDRMDLIRKAGEEAGTKLLLPMVMMLLIVMIIIMIPAYMSL